MPVFEDELLLLKQLLESGTSFSEILFNFGCRCTLKKLKSN